MTHPARTPALWPSMDVVHSASMLGTKEGQNCVHSVYSLSLLEEKKKKTSGRDWPQVTEGHYLPKTLSQDTLVPTRQGSVWNPQGKSPANVQGPALTLALGKS